MCFETEIAQKCRVTAHQQHRNAIDSEFQKIVVLRIAAISHDRGDRHALGQANKKTEKLLRRSYSCREINTA